MNSIHILVASPNPSPNPNPRHGSAEAPPPPQKTDHPNIPFPSQHRTPAHRSQPKPRSLLSWFGLLLGLASILPASANPESGQKNNSPGQSLVAQAAAAGPSESNRAKRAWYPFRGEVASIRPENRALHLRKQGGARIMRIDDASELQRDGKKITLDDVKIGEFVRGKVHRNAAGEEVITAATFEKEPTSSKSKARGNSKRDPADPGPVSP